MGKQDGKDDKIKIKLDFDKLPEINVNKIHAPEPPKLAPANPKKESN